MHWQKTGMKLANNRLLLPRISMCGIAIWLAAVLAFAVIGLSPAGAAEVAPWRHTMASAFGLVSAIAPVEQMSLTPPHFDLPPARPGTHAPEWLP